MTPFNAIYRHEMIKARHELDGNARSKPALFCDYAEKIHCRYGDMEIFPVCGDLSNGLDGKRAVRKKTKNFF